MASWYHSLQTISYTIHNIIFWNIFFNDSLFIKCLYFINKCFLFLLQQTPESQLQMSFVNDIIHKSIVFRTCIMIRITVNNRTILERYNEDSSIATIIIRDRMYSVTVSVEFSLSLHFLRITVICVSFQCVRIFIPDLEELD